MNSANNGWASVAAQFASDLGHRINGVVRSQRVHDAARTGFREIATAAGPAALNVTKAVRAEWIHRS